MEGHWWCYIDMMLACLRSLASTTKLCEMKIYLGNNLPPCVLVGNLLRRWQQTNHHLPVTHLFSFWWSHCSRMLLDYFPCATVILKLCKSILTGSSHSHHVFIFSSNHLSPLPLSLCSLFLFRDSDSYKDPLTFLFTTILIFQIGDEHASVSVCWCYNTKSMVSSSSFSSQ